MDGVHSGLIKTIICVGLVLLLGGLIPVMAEEQPDLHHKMFNSGVKSSLFLEDRDVNYSREKIPSEMSNYGPRMETRQENTSLFSTAGIPVVERNWQRSVGGSDDEGVWSVLHTNDGGYLIGGYTYSTDGDVTGNHGWDDAWIVKLGPAGNLLWQKCLGGTDFDSARSTIQTSGGGYLVTGFTDSNDGDVSGNHGWSDMWALKTDSSGNLVWQKCLGGTDDESSRSVIETTDGGYLLAGYTWSDDGDVSGNHGSSDYWIVKIDNLGNLIWQKCFGGSEYDHAYSVIETSDGGYLVAGYSYSNDGDVSGNHGNSDYWVINIDKSGNLIWQKCLGGSDFEYAHSVIETSDGGYLVAGYSYSNDGDVSGNHGNSDYWVINIDKSGNLIWQKSLGGSDDDHAYSVIETSDGGYLLAGYSWSDDGDVSGNHGYGDYWVVKLDNSGNLIWQQCLGGSDYDGAYRVVQNTDGRYFIGGDSESNDGDVSGNHGWSDIWVTLVSPMHSISASSDPWSLVHPYGTKSYVEGTNALYLTQGKPGAILEDVQVDEVSQGNISHYTFTDINDTHSINTTGTPVPGQIHVIFTISPQSGSVPLTVEFNDTSIGGPSSWYWQLGDGTSSPLQNLTHTYTIPGTYTVSLRAYNSQTGGYGVCNDCIQVNS
jgi:hypothetical protein